ncbi:MAG: tail fiber domain-containing protein [Bacteroidales bacterium]|nr:tail fiber domain-containing protein [Bacteroidales bacterium]
MKDLFTISKKVFILLGLFVLAFQAGAQVPEKFNYQLAVRDAQGNVYASQQVSFRVSIMQGAAVIYQESHTTQTNAYGLVNLMIGDGTPVQGSMAAIDWGGEPKSLKVEFDPAGGSSYADLATTPLLSVPYALYAKTSGDGGSGLTIGGENTQVQFNNNGTLSGSPHFVFDLLYNKVGIGTSTPSATLEAQGNNDVGIWGISTLGSGSSFGGIFQSYSSNGTGVRGEGATTGVQGVTTATSGVANGGYFVNLSDEGSGVFGFASGNSGNTFGGYFVSNSSIGKGVYGEASFTGVQGAATATTGNNYGGHFQSFSSEGTGVIASASATSGPTYGGYFYSASAGGRGVCSTSPNIAIEALSYGNSGVTFGGHFTSHSTEGTGIYAQAIATSGTTFGIKSSVSSAQGFSGFFSGGKFYISGSTGIGTVSPEAGLHLKGAGFPSSFMYLQSNAGQDAGFRIYEGTNVKWSIFNHSSSGGLNIYNTGGNTAIFAKQSNAFVGIGNTAPTQALDVNGNARIRAIGSGAYSGVVNRTSDGTLTTSTSDIRLKENIQTLQGGLDKVLQLRGVSFTWINNPEYGQRIGFIAQEFEKVIPELVFTNQTDGFKGINYAEVSAVLVEAIKEQQTQIDRLQQENQHLSARLERLERALKKLMNDDL